MRWSKEETNKSKIQEIQREMIHSSLYKKTKKEKPWLKNLIYMCIRDLVRITIIDFNSNTPTIEELIQKAEKTYERILLDAEKTFKTDKERWIRNRYEFIDDHMDEYMSDNPFYTLQNLYDEVIKCSTFKYPYWIDETDKINLMELDLPDHINIEARSRYLARNQIGHKYGMYSVVAVSPDGKYIVSGSMDDTVKVRELATGTLVRTLKGHKGSVKSVAVSPDGKYIISGSHDETVKVWDFKYVELERKRIESLQNILNEELTEIRQLLSKNKFNESIRKLDVCKKIAEKEEFSSFIKEERKSYRIRSTGEY